MAKEVSQEQFHTYIGPKLKREGKSIALCHGVFDLIHPGHIIHLEQAKEMADILVVSVTAAKYVRKGPDRPYFDDEMRMKVLSALQCVDYVILSEGYTVDDVMECVKPDYYVKGEEYKKPDDDLTGMISKEKNLVEAYGGQMAYTSGAVFSSTKLINNGFSGISGEIRDYVQKFKEKYSMNVLKDYAEKISGLRVLVIGDVIIDKYTYCDVQGLMTKDMGYSVRLQHSEEYLGGVLAIARHLSSFSSQVTVATIIGNETDKKEMLYNELAEQMRLYLLYSETFPTIVKERYLTRNEKREEYQKIFAVNNIPDTITFEKPVRQRFTKWIKDEIRNYDVVFLCDFGHGLVDKELIDLIQREAKYLVLNCQTNSTNRGMNIITKYTRADAFTLDQQELKLAFPEYARDEKTALKKLSEHLHGNGWLTRGSLGAYGLCDGQIYECPAFTLSIKDTVGAGDAFFSVAGIFAAVGAPIEVGTFMGNIAGALGVNIVGNRESVEKVNALKYASTLLNI